MQAESLACLICDAPLLLHQRAAGLCQQQSCRLTFQSIPPALTCRVCRRPLAFHERGAGVCGRTPCQHASYQELAREQREARGRATQELYQIGVAHGLVAEPESYRVTHLPSQHRTLSRASEQRRDAFLAHLDRLIAQCESEGWDTPGVTRTEPPPDPTTDELDAVSVQGCIGCKGHCCQTGSTHAWLTPETIRRLQVDNPGITPETIRSMYQARLGGQTFIESCVYHGEQGCLLPREIRSDKCNTHYCGDLRAFRRQALADPSPRAFMVWRGPSGDLEAAFVDPERVRPVRSEPTAAWAQLSDCGLGQDVQVTN